jgi:hypothetical protein
MSFSGKTGKQGKQAAQLIENQQVALFTPW